MTHSLDTFVKETGTRFRMTKEQTARVELTGLSAEDRARVATLSVEDAADFLKARSPKGKPLGWVKKAVEFAQNWQDGLMLEREQAFAEFIAAGGVEKAKSRKPEVPVAVWLDPELTLDNFEDKTFAATGHRIRFRILKEQTARKLTRAEALAEIVAQKKVI